MAGIADKLDKAYEAKPLGELADAPVAALQGVSDGDAEHLKAAFNITTIRDLGTNKFFLWAQAIAKLAWSGSGREISAARGHQCDGAALD